MTCMCNQPRGYVCITCREKHAASVRDKKPTTACECKPTTGSTKGEVYWCHACQHPYPAVEPNPTTCEFCGSDRLRAHDGRCLSCGGDQSVWHDDWKDAPAVEPDVIADARQDMRAASIEPEPGCTCGMRDTDADGHIAPCKLTPAVEPERTPHGEGCLCTPCRVEKWNREHGIEPEPMESSTPMPDVSRKASVEPERSHDDAATITPHRVTDPTDLSHSDRNTAPVTREPEQPTCPTVGLCMSDHECHGNCGNPPTGVLDTTTTATPQQQVVMNAVRCGIHEERARIVGIIEAKKAKHQESAAELNYLGRQARMHSHGAQVCDDLLAAIRGGDDALA